MEFRIRVSPNETILPKLRSDRRTESGPTSEVFKLAHLATLRGPLASSAPSQLHVGHGTPYHERGRGERIVLCEPGGGRVRAVLETGEPRGQEDEGPTVPVVRLSLFSPSGNPATMNTPKKPRLRAAPALSSLWEELSVGSTGWRACADPVR